MRLSRTGVLTWVLAVGVLAVLAPRLGTTVGALGSASFPAALGAVLELALVLVAGWAGLVLGACMLGGGAARVARHLVPRAVRGALLAGVLTGLSVGAVHADPGAAPPGPVGTALDGLVLPDRPLSAPDLARTAAVLPADDPPPERVVLVRPGDTVWDIAAASLDPRADAAEVARAAHRWYLANREVIGPDPDLIHPGQRLVAPEGVS